MHSALLDCNYLLLYDNYRNLWHYIDLDTDLFLTQESHCWWWRYLVWRCSSVTRWFPSPSSGKHSWRRTTVATVGQCTIASSPWSTTGSSIRLTRYGISDEIHILQNCTVCFVDYPKKFSKIFVRRGPILNNCTCTCIENKKS